jgi:hypothetical protein
LQLAAGLFAASLLQGVVNNQERGHVASVSSLTQYLEALLKDLPELAKEPGAPPAGLLLLDLDDTLITAHGVGGERFYNLLKKLNKDLGLSSSMHFEWSQIVRRGYPYVCCENPQRINDLLEAMEQQKNWQIKILTARKDDPETRERTRFNLQTAQITLFDVEKDIIFKPHRDIDKDQALFSWLEKQKWWSNTKQIPAIFLDDNLGYCQTVNNITQRTNRINLESCCYMGASPDEPLSDAERKLVVVQLLDLMHKLPVRHTHTPEEVTWAMKELDITNLRDDSLYKATLTAASACESAKKWTTEAAKALEEMKSKGPDALSNLSNDRIN